MTFQNFIVLGLIPGTQIQITFDLWLQVMAMLATVFIGWQLLVHKQQITILLLSLYARQVIMHHELRFGNLAH